jgi:hypothetical protein
MAKRQYPLAISLRQAKRGWQNGFAAAMNGDLDS